VPSFFCWRYPIMLCDPDLPPVLVYPVRHDRSWSEPPAQRVDSERARVLHRTGLVTTHRVGSAVRHTISQVGSDVLAGA
jgi:hypothetical protein